MSNSSVTSSPSRSTAGMNGPPPSAPPAEEFHFPGDIISIQDRKEQNIRVLKSDVMASLNKEVKAMDEDNWMFEGPRSRIHLISRQGGRLHQHTGPSKHHIFAPPK